MKISDLRVERFGHWTDLRLDRLSDRLTVFYGPNEAGKTTLMQFVRGVLYGFDAAGRRKYLPATPDGRLGGALRVTSPQGEYWIRRETQASGGRQPPDALDPAGTLALIGPDGLMRPDEELGELLGDIDEPIFNNVFAVGLREIQQLGALDDTQAAQLLYNLTSGLDRVSLVEVIRELENSRNRVLAVDDRPCLTTQLLAQRERLRTEIEELKETTLHWDQITSRGKHLDAQISELESDHERLARQAGALETALAVREPWRRRQELARRLDHLPLDESIPPDALELLTDCNAKIRHHGQQREKLREKRRALRDEARALGMRPALWRQIPRIEALADQQAWIESLAGQIAALEKERAELHGRREAIREQLGAAGGGRFAEPPILSPRALGALKPQARAAREAKEALHRAEREVAENEELAQSLEKQIEAALAEREEATLAAALETVGDRAAQLRRRVNIDERLSQLQRNRAELEEESLASLDHQLLPLAAQLGMGVVFVLGVVLVLAYLWVPSALLGAFGGALIGLGFLVVAAAVLWKFYLERAAAKKLVACNQQIEMLDRQLAQTTDERDALDRELPRGGGAMAARLQTAERELAALEELLPLDARRQEALQENQGADQRLERLKNELRSARAAWRGALEGAGLPDDLSPQQVRQLAGQRAQTAEVRERLERCEEELEQRRREQQAVAERVERLWTEAGFDADAESLQARSASEESQVQTKRELEAVSPRSRVGLVEQIRLLVAAANEEEAKMKRRRQLKRAWRKLKQKDRRRARAVAKLRRRRAALLRRAGTHSEEQFRRRVEQCEQAGATRAEYDKLRQEIAAALGRHADEAEIAALLEEEGEPLEDRWEQISLEMDAQGQRLKTLLEQRGELKAQRQSIADDRRLADRRIELGMVEQRLREALDDWRSRAVAGHLLDTLRREIEEHRQPETLLEASIYLGRLTGGHYVRVWTPMDQDLLYVDDRDGRRWPVDLLSRGTREQLFLGLRLALVALYARRGVGLPLVLDDVLVNFDQTRAQAAAELLRDFAKAGHQLLVFTCHEHVWRMFQTLQADARRLPDSRNEGEGERGRGGERERLVSRVSPSPILPVSPSPTPPVAAGAEDDEEEGEEAEEDFEEHEEIEAANDKEESLDEPEDEAEVELDNEDYELDEYEVAAPPVEVFAEYEETDEAAVEDEPPKAKPAARDRLRETGPFGWDVELEDDEAEAA